MKTHSVLLVSSLVTTVVCSTPSHFCTATTKKKNKHEVTPQSGTVDAHRFISQHMKRSFSPWRPPLARTHAQAAWWAPGSAWPAPPAGRRWPPGSSSGLLSTKQGRGGWVETTPCAVFLSFLGFFLTWRPDGIFNSLVRWWWWWWFEMNRSRFIQ